LEKEKIIALFQSVSIIGRTKRHNMAKISIFGVLSNIQMLVRTALYGTRVGVDTGGNTYYKMKRRGGGTRERRWVIYAGESEASLVPPEWHGWLHHQTDVVPDGGGKYRQPWQKPHQPNRTGTDLAYFPPGHAGGHRAPATGDYVAWQPPQ
jgi:NADH:ubiquinone oxidoreductase subunit